MDLEQEDRDRLEQARNDPSRLVVRAPSTHQKLGATTVVCLILNRTIGTSIFVAPAIILENTNSVGVSLLLWAFGALVAIAGLLVWLELGLSIPKFGAYRDGVAVKVNVPRSGAEKNYLEYIYSRPQFFSTCIFAVLYIIFGNASGNAIGFGTYIMQAAGVPGNAPAIRGLAIAALTVACLLHSSWRKGGILLNNALAIIKVAILLLIVGIGFAALGGASFGHGPVSTTNLDIHTSFSNPRGAPGSYADSFLYIMGAYNGFKQPFYVLSEVRHPHKLFARTTILAMISVSVLYMLVNIAYMGVVQKNQQLNARTDMASLFFKDIFGNEVATRVISGFLALSVFGNIVVSTFTACRVKQEIAKEGVLPFSHFFAKSTTTPVARLGTWLQPRNGPEPQEDPREQSPAAALLLHWIFAVLEIGATSGEAPVIAYTILFSLYSYVTIVVLGFFVAAGLLYLRRYKRHDWTDLLGFTPWGGPIAPSIYVLTCAFLLIAAFLPPSGESTFSYVSTNVQWYVVPTVGLGSLILGVLYSCVFRYVIPWIKGKKLIVERLPIVVRDEDGGWVQTHEIIDFEWQVPEREPVGA